MVMVSTFLCGTQVGLASVALSTTAAWYFIIPPVFSFDIDIGHVYALGAFVGVAILMVFIVGSLQRAVMAIERGRQREAMQDVRMRSAAELHRWTDVMQNIAIGIAVVDPESYSINFANEAFIDMHGLSSNRIQNLSVQDLYSPVEFARVIANDDIADRIGFADFESNRHRQDGSIFPARVHLTSVRRGNGGVRYRIVTVVDITVHRQLETELRRAQRLEAIGQLTAGIAHDFNNLLQGIMANLELLEDEIQNRPAARESLSAALTIAERGADLTRHLLSYAGRQVLRPKSLDLSAFLTEFQGLLSRTLGPRIRIETMVEPSLPPVWVDTTHLHTALLNLAINARDAMPSGGDLRIEAFSSAAGSDGPKEAGMDHMVVIRVSDTGTGIAAEILAKVCEPFFSTKGLNGTGLGLSMVYGFAKQSGGDLSVTSEPGKGTCVQLTLPLVSTHASGRLAVNSDAGDSEPGSVKSDRLGGLKSALQP
jgi:PAS domain S-box-containing protein